MLHLMQTGDKLEEDSMRVSVSESLISYMTKAARHFLCARVYHQLL